MRSKRETKRIKHMFLRQAVDALRTNGYRVNVQRPFLIVKRGNATLQYRVLSTRINNIVLMDTTNGTRIVATNGSDLAKKIQRDVTKVRISALAKRMERFKNRSFSVGNKKSIFTKPLTNTIFSRTGRLFSNSIKEEQKRENLKFSKMKSNVPLFSNSVNKTIKLSKKANTLEESCFAQKKENKVSLAHDRMLYGTKIDVKEKMKQDLQRVDLKRQEKVKILEEQKKNIVKNEENKHNEEQLNTDIQRLSKKSKMVNNDTTVDVVEKLGYLLPGCNIKYEQSFGVGSQGQRICNFNITFGGITRRCLVTETQHYLTKQPLYYVSTQITGGVFSANSPAELAEKIANGMISDINKESQRNANFILKDDELDDIAEAQNRIKQFNEKIIANNASKELISLNSDALVNYR